MKKVNIDDAFSILDDPDLSAPFLADEAGDPSADFTPSLPSRTWSATPSSVSTTTRSSIRQAADFVTSEKTEFPQIPLRSGRNTLNPIVMKALVHCQATYKVSDNDIKGIVVDFMNMVCGQKWEKEAIFDVSIESEVESATDDEYSEANKRPAKVDLFES